MGFSEEEIEEALNFKFSKGKYAKQSLTPKLDSTSNINKLYLFFEDTLALDSSNVS